jgi:hypothetical protein
LCQSPRPRTAPRWGAFAGNPGLRRRSNTSVAGYGRIALFPAMVESVTHPDVTLTGMSEPTVDQLAEVIERGLLAHPEVDEDRFAEILSQLVTTHPHYDLMWAGKQFGGQLYTEALGNLWLIVRYEFRGKVFDVGLIDMRHCVKGPGD